MAADALQQMPRNKIAMDACYKGPHEGKLANQVRAAGARLLHCPLGPTVVPFVRRLTTILVRGQYSLLHVHTQAHSGPAVYAAKSSGIPVITTFHSTQQPPQTSFTRVPGIRARDISIRGSACAMHYGIRRSPQEFPGPLSTPSSARQGSRAATAKCFTSAANDQHGWTTGMWPITAGSLVCRSMRG